MSSQHNRGVHPVTPPRDTQSEGDLPPSAPRHRNSGRIGVNGNVASSGRSPRIGRATQLASVDTSTMMPGGNGPARQPQANFNIFQDAPQWNGPQVVSGQQADPNDPFVSAPLAGDAPAFVPSGNAHQSGPPGPGSSSSPGGGPSDGGSSHRRSNGGGGTNGSGTNGSSGGMSGGRNNSSHSNGQSSDNSEPVIVTTPLPGGKGKQAVRPQTPDNTETRFLRIDNVYAVDFDEKNALGLIKGLPLFKDNVQKLGVFGLKAAGANSQTAFLFVDTLTAAKELHKKIRRSHHVEYISCETFKAADILIPDTIDRFSAKIAYFVAVKEHSRSRRFNTEVVTEMAKTAAARFGKIKTFDLVDDSGFALDGRLHFDVEYDSVADANDVVHTTNPVRGLELPFGSSEHLNIQALGYDPVDANSPAGQASANPQTPSSGRQGSGIQDDLDYSPSGRTATRTTASGKIAAVVGNVRPSKMAGPSNHTQAMMSNSQVVGQYGPSIYQTFDPSDMPVLGPDGRPHPAAAKPQDVVEWRIEQGYDVRTTLMVRNIPPEMTGADFVDMLQMTVPGQFDFAYNRIDFQKSQSVGYAFANFTSTEALLRFVRTWRGKLLPHNCHRQHLRPCAVSYANTQGYECLVAKFRNSSILDEAKPCRPCLFWTAASAGSNPHLIGQERDWPPVDNASKKGRSVENAKISGLYTPRARVNGGRGGRRGGHTRFDRGTPGQQHEESPMAFGNYQCGVGPSPGYGHFAQPRFQPTPALYNWNNGQFVPQGPQIPQGMMYPPPQFQLPMMQPPPQYQPIHGHLRTHTHGDLGYRHPVMPATLAPVNSPTQAQPAHQDQVQPLLYPVKGQVPEFYRPV